ncbi:hypothetical protein V5G65_03665 [Mammaliicoccus sciuri]|uniref:hypothetical protein n=1 Tax=Mammaliicoccus sciuri TaxID=1296 RepID=UPI00378EA95D
MQSPQLQIYNCVFARLQGLGVDVISFKEMKEHASYPFFVVSEVNQTKSLDTFDSFKGYPNIKVDLWSTSDDRGKHDELFQQVDNILCYLGDFDDFQTQLNDITTSTMEDDTTNQMLIHSSFIAEYKAY